MHPTIQLCENGIKKDVKKALVAYFNVIYPSKGLKKLSKIPKTPVREPVVPIDIARGHM